MVLTMASNKQHSAPLVSIVMPTLNMAKFIGETIDSICRQTYSNWELLVMDDGSDDMTNKVVERFQANDDRIRYNNNGVKRITGKLRNKGMELANGELIVFINADDIWPADKLEKQVAIMQTYPEAGYSFTNALSFRSEDRVVENICYERQAGHVCADFFKSVCSGEITVYISSMMVWKHLTPENLFRTNRKFTDFSFITNLAQQYKGVIIYDLLLQRRARAAGSSNAKLMADYEEHIETINRYKQEHKLDAAFANHILFDLHIKWGEEYLTRNLKKESRKVFRHAWQYNKMSVVPFKKTLKSIVNR